MANAFNVDPSKIAGAFKLKYTEEVGIDSKLIKLPEKTKEAELIKVIEELNKDKKVTGIILQSPTPDHIDFTKCARLIDPKKDVDGFAEENLFSIRDNNEKIIPCTVKGILKLFDYYKTCRYRSKCCWKTKSSYQRNGKKRIYWYRCRN